MEIQANGSILKIDYLNCNDDIDAAFRTLFSKFSNDEEKNIVRLFDEYLPEFEPHLMIYFKSIGANTKLQDNCLTNLMAIWRAYFHMGRLDEAMLFIIKILEMVLDFERYYSVRVHKGTPLYHWGGTAILKGEIDKGFFLIHSALDEDAETHNKEFPQTPANRFVTLDFQDIRQFYGPIVSQMADYLNTFLIIYRPLIPSPLQLAEFRERFLANPPNKDAVFMFIHSLARLMQFDRLPSICKQNRFVGQFEANILLDLALVIEDVIKKINPTQGTFYNHISFLLSQSGLSLNQNDLGPINDDSQQDFDQTLLGLLNRIYTINNRNLNDIESDIAITYILRNRAAHHLSSSPALLTRFSDVCQGIFNVIFFCVDVLYQPSS